MLTERDYAALGAGSGLYTVCEMDREGNCRRVEVTPANPTGDWYSVAKLFTVTAVGLCVDRGLLSPSDRFLSLMELPLPAGADPKWEQVTLHMLLRHRWGLAEGFLDIDVEDARRYPSRDWLSLVLQRPLPKELGEEYCYSDAAFYLLSLAVEKVSGKRLFDLLRSLLMEELAFGEYAWSSCPLGHTVGATGLFVRCEDAVKLGVLYLNGGLWKGKRLLSRSWCRTVAEQGYELSRSPGGWLYKGGMRGQMLAFHPEKELAVAWMGFHSLSPRLLLEDF